MHRLQIFPLGFFIVFFLLVGLSVKGQEVSFTTKEKNLPCLDKQFTVFVHMYVDSFSNTGVTEDTIRYALNEASKKFLPICVSFTPCLFDTFPTFQFDTLGANDFGRLREMEKRHNLKDVINIHIISEVRLLDGDQPFGYAFQNGIAERDSGSIVISKIALLETPLLLTHLLGHYFGLMHTFGDGQELVDGTNCDTAGDKICDTPADPISSTFPQAALKMDDNCLFTDLSTDANSTYYIPDVANIMSKYIQCYCTFSRLQYLKMAENYLNSIDKKW